MLGVFAILLLFGGALCRPAEDNSAGGNFSTQPLSPEDRVWLTREVPMARTALPAGFHYMYVSRTGQIVEDTRPASGDYIEVVGSPHTPLTAMYRACLTVGKMMRNTRPAIFNKIARKPGSGVGLFTAEEKVTVFPQAAYLRSSPQCEGRCDGSCSSTCTFDGRKFANIPGITIGSRSFALVDNVLCTEHDPYDHHDNIVVHEFAHTLQRHGFSGHEQRQLTQAYAHAKRSRLWAVGSYAMGNSEEYFAEGTGVFFLVNLFYSSGGMSNCPGNHKCQTEQEARQRLHDRDLQLWTLLTEVYTQGDASLSSGLSICPASSG